MIISSSLITIIIGINSKIKPTKAINKDKIWWIKIFIFNINFENKGIKNKKYSLSSKTYLSPIWSPDIVAITNKIDINNKIINIYNLFLFEASINIYLIEEDDLSLYVIASFLVWTVFVLMEEIKYNKPPPK